MKKLLFTFFSIFFLPYVFSQSINDIQSTDSSKIKNSQKIFHSCYEHNVLKTLEKITSNSLKNQSNSNARQIQSEPPFGGTIFIEPGIIVESDPTVFVNITYSGTSPRNVYDRRSNIWELKNSHIFEIKWKDQQNSEAIVNLEFNLTEATAAANKYAYQLGQLPYILRKGVNQIMIHKGLEPWGGSPGLVLIHTDYGASYYDNTGISEETLVHEASHASLDYDHGSSSGWLAAQALDPNFISTYARDYPTREDIAETFLTWMAVRYYKSRISALNYTLITQAIPYRLAYFDAQSFNLNPILCTPLCIDTDGDGLTGTLETSVCRNETNTSDFSIDFDLSYESSNTFNTANIANFSINNGIMSGTSLGDAQLYQNPKYLFKGRLVPKLIVKMKANAANALQLFWTNEDGGFSESRVITTEYTASNAWQYLEIDLSSHPQWMTKTIRQLRIDPANAANVSFEIDWIRAIDYSDCTCSGNTNATILFNNSEWSYYGLPGTTDPLFAIQHTPAGGNTTPFTAEIRLNKPCLENYGIVGITNYNSKEATLVAGNYWNISLTSGTTNGFVNIRHFTNTTLNNQLDTESNNFYTISGATNQSPSIYFKTNVPLQLPQDLRADGKGLNYGFSALLPAQTGIFNGKSFLQFNQITDINNSGGGLLKRVTTLNENSFLSAQDMLKLKGTLRYNNVFDRFEGFNGLVWKPLH